MSTDLSFIYLKYDKMERTDKNAENESEIITHGSSKRTESGNDF